jgi:fatty acid desaturase
MDRDLTYEVVDDSRRYALGATADFYGVWDKQTPGEPLARFPLTDEGLAQAEERFKVLRRAERSYLDMLPLVLGWATLLGIAVWVVAGIVFQVFFTEDLFPGFGEEASQAAARFFFLVENVAFRVWIGSLASLAALWLFRALRPHPHEPTT